MWVFVFFVAASPLDVKFFPSPETRLLPVNCLFGGRRTDVRGKLFSVGNAVKAVAWVV